MKNESLLSNRTLIIVAAVVIGAIIGIVLISSGGAPDKSSGDAGAAADVSVTATDPQTDLAGSRAVEREETPASVGDWFASTAPDADTDRPAAMRKALAIRDPGLREAVIAELAAKWIDADTDGFLAFLDEMEDNEDAGEREWMALAPGLREALPKVGDDAASSLAFEEVIERLVENMAYQNPAEALAWSREWLLEESLEAALSTIAPELAATDPEAAKALLAEITNPMLRLDALSGLGFVLGESQGADALGWATSIENPEERAEATSGILEAMAEADPDRAAQEFARVFAGLSASDSPDEGALDALSIAASVIAGEMAIQNPQGALAWSETLPEGAMRDEAVESIFLEWAEREPEAAFAAYSARQDRSDILAEVVFESWAIADPAGASQAVSRLTDPEERQGAISGVIIGWLDTDLEPDRILEWVRGLPNDADRDMATGMLVEELTFDYPELAWRQSQTIRDEEIRSSAMRDAFLSLVETNPEAARNALESIQATPQQEAEFRAMLEASAE